jgi:hypothetical protein
VRLPDYCLHSVLAALVSTDIPMTSSTPPIACFFASEPHSRRRPTVGVDQFADESWLPPERGRTLIFIDAQFLRP